MSSGRSLAPSFLVAMPQLKDSNFERSVVLLCKHSPTGAFGVIVNRPLITQGRVTVTLDPPVSTDRELQVWIGGPVEQQKSWILVGHEPDEAEELTAIRVAESLYLSTSPDLLRRLLEPTPPPMARLIVGYAGWGPGQLEAELEESSWIVESSTAPELFPEPEEDLWAHVLRDKGGVYRVVALMPEDPSVN